MRKLLCVLTLVLAGCGRKTPPPAPASPPAPPARVNLLQLTRGAVVVSRTAESSLNASAVRLIDGSGAGWSSPPDDGQQSITLALPGPSRIDELGLTSTSVAAQTPEQVRFELSEDGERFVDAGAHDVKASRELQRFPVTPAVASYVRISTLGAQRTVHIGGIFAAGSELSRTPASLAGCWTINGAPASFTARGSAAAGTIGGMYGMTLDGGSDGRFYRFAWVRGAEYGLAAIAAGDASRHLNAVVWHEEALDLAQFRAPDMLGERAPCQAAATPQDVFRLFIERLQYFPLYGLRFDEAGRLMEAESEATLVRVMSFLSGNPTLRVRFRTHELTASTSQQNRAVAEQKAQTLRAALQRRGAALAHAEFMVLGAEQPRRETGTATTRAMYSSVELEVVR